MANEVVTNIDDAIAAAEKRQETKTGNRRGRKPGSKKLSPEERAARNAQKSAEKAEKLAAREARKAARVIVPRASKLERAAAKLPVVEGAVSDVLIAAANLAVDELETVIAHLQHRIRCERTETAKETALVEGQEVRIICGRHAGKSGLVAKVNRIRCYVTTDYAKKPVYLFTSEVEPV